MHPSLKGNIFISDKNIKEYNSVEFSKVVSLVLTERIPSSNLTVYELIALGRQVYTNWIGTLSNEDKTKIDEAINQVKINSITSKRVDELSDGQY